MRTHNRLVAVLLLAGAGLFCQWSVNAEPKDLEIAFVTPTVQPTPGIPDGRRDKTAERPLLRTHGSFHELVRDQIAALRVTWWDEDRFKNRDETESFVRSLLIASRSESWTYPPWAQGFHIPSIALDVEVVTGTVGRWLVWYHWPAVYCAYHDGGDVWWFAEWYESELLRLECDQPRVLIAALNSTDDDTRSNALMRLRAAAPGNAEAGRAVLPFLQESDPELRWRATWALGAIREPIEEVAPALVKLLTDHDPSVRQNAALVLGNFPTEAELIVPALLEAFRHPEPYVRYHALVSVRMMIERAENLPTTELRQALLLLCQTDEFTAESAKFALDQLDRRADRANNPHRSSPCGPPLPPSAPGQPGTEAGGRSFEAPFRPVSP